LTGCTLKIYDLEAFVENKRGKQKDDVLLHDAKFKVVLNERIIPPLEVLDGKADRELILAHQRVFSQKQLDHPVIFKKMVETMAPGNSTAGENDAECTIEYDDAGNLPDGAFLFRDLFPVLHVDKRGRVKQVDLMRKSQPSAKSEEPINKEFKNMLIQEYKQHAWEDLTKLFFKNA